MSLFICLLSSLAAYLKLSHFEVLILNFASSFYAAKCSLWISLLWNAHDHNSHRRPHRLQSLEKNYYIYIADLYCLITSFNIWICLGSNLITVHSFSYSLDQNAGIGIKTHMLIKSSAMHSMNLLLSFKKVSNKHHVASMVGWILWWISDSNH